MKNSYYINILYNTITTQLKPNKAQNAQGLPKIISEQVGIEVEIPACSQAGFFVSMAIGIKKDCNA